jgi:hypothetical protein
VPFIELPDGTLLNSETIVSATPLTSGATRVAFIGGTTKDVPEEFGDLLRKELKPPKKPRTTNKHK